MARAKRHKPGGKSRQQKAVQQQQQQRQHQQQTNVKPKPSSRYDSASESDDDPIQDLAAVIPLASVEQGTVVDFTSSSSLAATAAAAAAGGGGGAGVGAHGNANHQKNKSKKRKSRGQDAVTEADAKFNSKLQVKKLRAEKIVWRKFMRENQSFEKYYNKVLRLEDQKSTCSVENSAENDASETEWQRLVKSLQQPPHVHLAANETFASLSEVISAKLEQDYKVHQVPVKVAIGDHQMIDFLPVGWHPDQNVLWKLSAGRKQFHAVMRSLCKYERAQSTLGTLLRVDPYNYIVSAFCDVQPGHRVLDLAGSGEYRAMFLAKHLASAASTTAARWPQGALVINHDSAPLADRAGRMIYPHLGGSTAACVGLTCHKPEEFPIPDEYDDALLFDRVVCCVSCTTDGMIRHRPEIWRQWDVSHAFKRHNTQVTHAKKALALLCVGGLAVYSTRSLNPIEDEAVVAEVLRSGKGAYELVDVSNVLPSFKRRQGLSEWPVCWGEDLSTVESWKQATQEQKNKLRCSMWPPTQDEVISMALNRCVRFLPHQNDTHGGFLAVFRKKSHVEREVALGPQVPGNSTAKADHVAKIKAREMKKKRKVVGGLVPVKVETLDNLKQEYEISSKWQGQLLEPVNFGKESVIYAVTNELLKVVESFGNRLLVHRAGIGAFHHTSGSAGLDLTDVGVRGLVGFLGEKRLVKVEKQDFELLLESKDMWLKEVPVKLQMGNVLMEKPLGCIVAVLDDAELCQTANLDLFVLLVKRHNSISLASSVATVSHMKALLGQLDGETDDDEDLQDGYDSMEYDED